MFPMCITAAQNAVQFAQTDPHHHIPEIHKHAILYLRGHWWLLASVLSNT